MSSRADPDRKRRLCIVNPFEHGGGAEYQISQLVDALAASGRYEVYYLARFIDARERARRYQIVQVGAGGPISPLGYLMDAPALYRRLREIDPGLIYQRVACAYTGICAYYARSRSVPLVWHVAHDTDVMPGTLDRARNILKVRLEKWAVEYGLRRANRIVVQTRRQSELLSRYYARPADALIPNFHPAATETLNKSGPLTVVWIANLKPWKRPEAFVRLAQALQDREGVRFIMVGAPEGSGSAWERALLASIEATRNLEFLGQRSHEEVNRLLARAHIFVNTSRYEGFPNTFVQAWLREAVVVSLEVDPDGVLERDGMGILAGSEDGLRAAVGRLIDHPEQRAEYARRGREHAAAHHSLSNAGELVRLFDSCAVP